MQSERIKLRLLSNFVFFILHFAIAGSLLHAAEAEKELEGIKKKIEREKQGISQVKKKEGSVLESLTKIEEELDRKNRELKKVNATLEFTLGDLQKKEKEAQQISASIAARRELLKKRAVALFRWQRGGSPFVLLNGSASISELMQRKRYLELTLAFDRALLKQLSEASMRQQALKKELGRRGEELDKQRRALVSIKESVRVEKEKKRDLLAGLKREKEGHLRALKELEEAAHRLQKMMDELARKSAPPARDLPPGSGFEALRGKLDYPVRGAIMSEFGKTRHPEFSAELFRKGIDIDAPVGEEVRAVEEGKVIFADRFSGYGKMMIIDHGQRYYTVYAHLSDILKRAGEAVRRGEPIAQVGDSDSLTGARLYFEIRKDGKPLDPLPWFKK